MGKISIIAAIDRRNAIGNHNKLLYWLPNDLKRFKQLTTGHTIIMGRKTFDSLPKGALPNRKNVVITRNKDLMYPGAVCYYTLEEALEHCAGDDEVFIIGGESVYRQAMPFADCLYLTEVDDTASEADAFFPEVDKTVWKEKSRVRCSADEKHLCSYSFVDYERE